MITEPMGEFQAKGSNGVTYTIKELRDRLADGAVWDGEPSTDPASWKYIASVAGSKQGFCVRRHGKGRYQILDTEITLTSSDPNAL